MCPASPRRCLPGPRTATERTTVLGSGARGSSNPQRASGQRTITGTHPTPGGRATNERCRLSLECYYTHHGRVSRTHATSTRATRRGPAGTRLTRGAASRQPNARIALASTAPAPAAVGGGSKLRAAFAREAAAHSTPHAVYDRPKGAVHSERAISE